MAYTTINKSTDYFNTKLYTGNGGTQSITGVGFQPDFNWTKSRTTTQSHVLTDAVRGVTKTLFTNATQAEATLSGITAFGTDGYTLGASDLWSENSASFASWNWKANGAGSANTDGSISSTVSANTTSGFSIVSYTGNETVSTIGHGLGVTPSMIIVKGLISARDWIVGHHTQGWTKSAMLNEANAFSSQTHWNNTAPTSSVFTIEGGSNSNVNTNNAGYIAYCFAEKQGYSKFGSYTGNGSTDGTFVYTGFKPAFVLVKRTDAVANWSLIDNTRDPFNVTYHFLEPNVSDAEFTPSGPQAAFDFCSQGFKCRSTNGAINASGGTYIYMAFAEAPLVGSNGVTAKAR